MKDRYELLAADRLAELRADASPRVSNTAGRNRAARDLRVAVGHALVRMGERLSSPASAAVSR